MEYLFSLPQRFYMFIQSVFYTQDHWSKSEVGDESADESDWSSEDDGSSSKRPRNDGGHRKARRNRSRKERKQKANKSLDDKQETVATPAPSAPVSRLAEVLSSKEGLKSAALKSTARDLANNASEETEKKRNSDSTMIIKIKPPPPTAPKPRAKKTSSSQSSDCADEKSVDTKTKHAGENTKVVAASHGPVEDSIFDGLEIAKPKLTSYKRTMGPQGRRLPQRYSNQVQFQRFSNQSNNSLAAVSA